MYSSSRCGLCLTEVVVAFFCLDVDVRCLDCIQVADIDCISDVIVAITLDDMLVTIAVKSW